MVNVIQYGKIETSLRRFVLAAVVTLAVGRAAANDVTWVGAATGGVWSEPSNWLDATTSENHVPTADDIAVFTPTTTGITNTLDVATTVKGIKVTTGRYALNGTEKLTLGLSGINGETATGTIRINVPIELSAGDVVFRMPTANKAYYIDLNGVVSGAGRIYMYGSSSDKTVRRGTLLLRQDNTFTGGIRCYGYNNTDDEFNVYVYKSASLGGPDADGNYGTVTLQYYNKIGGVYFVNTGMTINNPITINGGSAMGSLYFANAVETITFNGTNTITGGANYRKSGSSGWPYIYFKKPVVQTAKTQDYVIAIHGADVINTRFYFQGGLDIGKTQFKIYNRGKIYAYAVTDFTQTWGGLVGRGGCIYCQGDYVLPTASGAYLDARAYSVYDLQGHPQKLNRICWDSSSEARSEVSLTSSSKAASLEVINVDNKNDTWKGVVSGYLTFIWNPKSANSMSFYTQTSTTTGDLIVSNGTVKLTSAAKFTKLGAVRVSDGAKFQMDSGSEINVKAKLYIYGTGQVVLPSGMTIEVADVYVDGEQQEHGETFSGKSWISGGSVYITDTIVQSAATWDGGAGAADTSVGTAANWSDDTLPDLATGGLTATFATGGSTATVDRAVKLYKATLSAADGFTLADGGGTLQIGKGGLTTSVAATNRFDTPVVLNGAQTWTVDPANASVVAEEALSSPLGGVLTKAGAGSLTLKGANTFTGNLEVNAGIVYLTGANATAGSSDVGQVSVGTGGKLYLNNAVLNRPLVCAPTGYFNGVGQLDAVAGTDNLVLGDVVVTQNGNTGRNLNLWPEEKARLVLAGGVSYASFLFANGPGEVVFSNKSFRCSAVGTYGLLQTPTIRFQVAGNTTSADASGATSRDKFTLGDTARPTVHFEVSNVFAANNGCYPTLKGPTRSNGSATVYLHGTTQRFDGLLADYENATVTSTEPGAVLNIMQWTAATNLWAVNGHVSINKWGTSELAFGQSGATADNFAVSAGTLRILPAAKFPNLTALAASSSGVLAIEATDAISKNCDITLDGTSAKLNLNFNGTLKCGRLLMRNALNELRPVAAGIYGAKGSGAPRELANITGTGLLFVRKPSGFMMFFK